MILINKEMNMKEQFNLTLAIQAKENIPVEIIYTDKTSVVYSNLQVVCTATGMTKWRVFGYAEWGRPSKKLDGFFLRWCPDYNKQIDDDPSLHHQALTNVRSVLRSAMPEEIGPVVTPKHRCEKIRKKGKECLINADRLVNDKWLCHIHDPNGCFQNPLTKNQKQNRRYKDVYEKAKKSKCVSAGQLGKLKSNQTKKKKKFKDYRGGANVANWRLDKLFKDAQR